MNKFWTVLFHTYKSKLLTKQFVITTIIVGILIVGVSNIDNIIDMFNKDSTEKVAVLDDTGELFAPLSKQAEQSTEDIKLVDYTKSENQAKKDVQKGDLTGYLLLDTNNNGIPEGTYKADKIAEQSIIDPLQQSLQQVKVAVAAQHLGLNADQVEQVYTPVSFDKVALEKGAKSETELNQARLIVYGIVLLMFFSVMMYGMMIAMEVATEKSSRVMEILISSVSPVKQMFGKIFGIALLGMTQFAFLFAVGSSSFLTFTSDSGMGGEILDFLSFDVLSPAILVYAVIFFVLGFLLYATLLAMLGSLINRVEEANQMMMPVIFIILGGFYIAMFGMMQPDTSFITVTSFIPFFSPMIMMLRVGMLSVPFWQVALSLALLVATILFFVIVGARIYRGGVLMYGKSTSWKSIKQAFVLTKSEK